MFSVLNPIRKRGKMEHIQAPKEYVGLKHSIFLAGGITSCPEWQDQAIEMLSETNLVVVNPRRDDFDASNPDMEMEQISWEHRHLARARAVLFWFPKETLCPITLFELGAMLPTNKIIYIGMDPEYKRRSDVEIQSRLARSWLSIDYDLKSLMARVERTYEGW